MVCFSVAMLAFSSKFSVIPGMAGIQGVLSITYLILAAIMIYPIIKGFQFAGGVKAACLTNNEAELARGFSGMQGYLQFMGILVIIVLIIYGLLLIGGLAAIGIAASAA